MREHFIRLVMNTSQAIRYNCAIRRNYTKFISADIIFILMEVYVEQKGYLLKIYLEQRILNS